jgi:hypothetical protein
MKNTLGIVCRRLVFTGWLFSPLAAAEEGEALSAAADGKLPGSGYFATFNGAPEGTGAVQYLSIEGGNAAGAPFPLPAARNDPFQISYLMRQRAYRLSQGGAQFVAAPGAKTPAMVLKGLVNKKLALLEIQGVGIYMVREGDSLSFNNSGENLVIKIDKIDSLSLNVKVGTLQEVIVVR